jgi:hypothetical protein
MSTSGEEARKQRAEARQERRERAEQIESETDAPKNEESPSDRESDGGEAAAVRTKTVATAAAVGASLGAVAFAGKKLLSRGKSAEEPE